MGSEIIIFGIKAFMKNTAREITHIQPAEHGLFYLMLSCVLAEGGGAEETDLDIVEINKGMFQESYMIQTDFFVPLGFAEYNNNKCSSFRCEPT